MSYANAFNLQNSRYKCIFLIKLEVEISADPDDRLLCQMIIIGSLSLLKKLAAKILIHIHKFVVLIHCLLVSSAHSLCKQIRPRSGPTFCRALAGSNVFDTHMVLLKEFFEKADFEKKSADNKIHEKILRGQPAYLCPLLVTFANRLDPDQAQ